MPKRKDTLHVVVKLDRAVMVRQIEEAFERKIRKDVTDEQLSKALADNITNFFASSATDDYFIEGNDAGDEDFDDLFEAGDDDGDDE